MLFSWVFRDCIIVNKLSVVLHCLHCKCCDAPLRIPLSLTFIKDSNAGGIPARYEKCRKDLPAPSQDNRLYSTTASLHVKNKIPSFSCMPSVTSDL